MNRSILQLIPIIIALAFCTSKSHRVTGIIKGIAGNPIVNALITEKGMKDTVTADHLGRYSIKVSSLNAIIVISSFAYATAEIKVNGRKKIDIMLKPAQEKPWDYN